MKRDSKGRFVSAKRAAKATPIAKKGKSTVKTPTKATVAKAKKTTAKSVKSSSSKKHTTKRTKKTV